MVSLIIRIVFCCGLATLNWYLLGMDDSNRRGRRTRKALRDFTLMPSICSTANSEENKLKIIHVEVSILRGQVVVLPYHNNGKVEDIPGVPQIGIWM